MQGTLPLDLDDPGLEATLGQADALAAQGELYDRLRQLFVEQATNTVAIVNIEDFRRAARRRLPRPVFEYIDGGAYAETTLSRNVVDLEAIALRQRVMVDTKKLDLSTEVVGQGFEPVRGLPLRHVSLGRAAW